MHSTRTGRRFAPSHRFPSALCGLIAIVCLAIGPAASAQLPSPHRSIPAKGLVAYLEFDGLRDHAEAWKKTAAFALLADTPAGSMISEVARQVLDELLKLNAGGKLTGADLLALHEHLMQHGVVIALHECGNESYSTTIILKNARDGAIRKPLDRLAEWILSGQAGNKRPTAIKLRGRDVYGRLPKAPQRDRDGFPALGRGEAESAPVLNCQSAWYEGGDLVLIIGPDAVWADLIDADKEKELGSAHLKHRAAVLDTIEGKQPNVTTHAAFISTLAEGKDVKGFEPDGLFFADAGTAVRLLAEDSEQSYLRRSERMRAEIAAVYAKREPQRSVPAPSLDGLVPSQPAPFAPGNVPSIDRPAPPQAAPVAPADTPSNPLADLGLSGVNRIAGRWGVQGKALFTVLRIDAPSPRKGFVRIIDQPLFVKDQLPPIPRDSTTFAVASVDAARAYETLVSGLKTRNPELLEQFTQLEKSVERTAGLKLREDLLKRLGPTWTLFRITPAQGQNAAEKPEFNPTDYALLARVDDPAAFDKVLDGVAARISQYFREAYKVPGGQEDDPPILALERLPAPDRGFQLTSPSKLVTWLSEDRPTILVGKAFVSCALGLEPARQALAGESKLELAWKPQGELREAVECLPERLMFLAVVDDRDSPLPEQIAGLPALRSGLHRSPDWRCNPTARRPRRCSPSWEFRAQVRSACGCIPQNCRRPSNYARTSFPAWSPPRSMTADCACSRARRFPLWAWEMRRV